MKKIEIIPSKNEHVSGIVEIWKELMDFHGKLNPYWTCRKNAHRYFAKRIKNLMRSRKSLVLVALDGKQVAGFSIVVIHKRIPDIKQESYGYITNMAVRKTHRRKGIGSKMMKEVFVWLKAHRINSVQLAVADKNLIGHSFWKKHGFIDLTRTMLLSNLK